MHCFGVYESKTNSVKLNISLKQTTVKPTYSEHSCNELTIIVKLFLFHLGFKHFMKLTGKRNYIYNEAKSPIPGTSLLADFTVNVWSTTDKLWIFCKTQIVTCKKYTNFIPLKIKPMEN